MDDCTTMHGVLSRALDIGSKGMDNKESEASKGGQKRSRSKIKGEVVHNITRRHHIVIPIRCVGMENPSWGPPRGNYTGYRLAGSKLTATNHGSGGRSWKSIASIHSYPVFVSCGRNQTGMYLWETMLTSGVPARSQNMSIDS